MSHDTDTDTDTDNALAERILAEEDERIEVRRATRWTVLLAVLPDPDEDDCLAEATEAVDRLYGAADGVSSVTCEGWEGGEDGQRDRVLVLVCL